MAILGYLAPLRMFIVNSTYPLLLTARQPQSSLAHFSLVPFWEAEDPFVDTSRLTCSMYLLSGGIGVCVLQVIEYTGIE